MPPGIAGGLRAHARARHGDGRGGRTDPQALAGRDRRSRPCRPSSIARFAQVGRQARHPGLPSRQGTAPRARAHLRRAGSPRGLGQSDRGLVPSRRATSIELAVVGHARDRRRRAHAGRRHCATRPRSTSGRRSCSASSAASTSSARRRWSATTTSSACSSRCASRSRSCVRSTDRQRRRGGRRRHART